MELVFPSKRFLQVHDIVVITEFQKLDLSDAYFLDSVVFIGFLELFDRDYVLD